MIPLVMWMPVVLFGSFLFLGLTAFLNKMVIKPLLLQRKFTSQGIKGPGYKFIFGNAREIIKWKKEAESKPMSNLSHDIRPRLEPHMPAWTKAYGRNFVFWVGPQPLLVVSEPELAKVVLNETGKVFEKLRVTGYFKKVFGDGLATSRGDKWVNMKKLTNFAFHGESLKGMAPAMIASIQMMLQRWDEHVGKEIEVYQEFGLLTAEVISRTAFGNSYKQGKLIFDMMAKLVVLLDKNAFKITLPFLSKIYKPRDEIEAEKLEQGMKDSIVAMIRKREEMMMSGEADGYGTDFLGLLVKAHHQAADKESSMKISVQDMVDECKTFYIVGQETTNKLLSWAMLLLSLHPDWQEEARKEVMAVFGRQTPDPDGISKLKTMTMIINETLRLYTPAFDLMRTSEKEVRLGKFVIPADTILSTPILSFHHDPEIWGEDVHLFKPERFSEGVAKATNNVATAFFPFGMGPRICTGMNFAPQQAKIALSMILQRYSFTLSPAYIHSPMYAFTVFPQHGVQVILHAF